LDAGESAGALGKACGVSWSQARYRRAAAGAAGGAVTAALQVLSVVEPQTSPARSASVEGGIELRVGPWRIDINRVTE